MSETELADLHSEAMKRTGAQTIAELSDKVMFAIKPSWFGGRAFRPGVPARFLRFAMREIDGKAQPCVILGYLNSLDGTKILEHAHPAGDMWHTLEFIGMADCTATYIKRDRLEKGF